MYLKSAGGQLGLHTAEHPVPPGYLVPPHIHADDDEAFYIVTGDLTLLSDQGETVAGPGSTVLLPRGKMHGFRNDTDRDARVLVVCQPGSQALEMFRHFDRAREAATGGLTPTDIAAISARYGV